MPKRLMEEIDVVTQMLDDIVRGKIIKPSTGELESELKFVISRKWNSWYPSYFNTQGGCYAFITRDPEQNLEKNSGVIVVDPGVKFSENLRKYYNIEPHDIRSVVISHYHPDHTMGLYELLTLTHESHHPCSYYLNRTTYDSFKVFQGKYNRVIEMTENQIIKLAGYKYSIGGRGINDQELRNTRSCIVPTARPESIYLRTIKTYHHEIGDRHNSLGFVFHVLSGERKHELVLLGDTDGNEKYLDLYLEYLKNADVAILHLGSFSERGYGTGDKHLYKTGLINILNCINCVKKRKIPDEFKEEGRIKECLNKGIIRKVDNGSVIPSENKDQCKLLSDKDYFEKLKLVIISELGLEMASPNEFLSSLDIFKWSTRLYPFLLFSKFYNENDEYICEFDKNTEGIEMEISDKIKIHRKVFSTKAIESIEELIKETLGPTLSCEIYNFSIFWGSFMYYLTLPEISTEKWEESFYESYEKLKIILDKLDSSIECEEYSRDDYTFDNFIDDFEQQMSNPELSGFIEPLERTINNFLKKLIKSVYLKKLENGNERTYESILDDISSFSKKIFYAVRIVASFTSESNITQAANFKEFASFVKAISLFNPADKETFDFIRNLVVMDRKFNFNSLLYLLAHELNKQAKSLSEELAGAEEENDLMLSRDLLTWIFTIIITVIFSQPNELQFFP